MTELSKATMYAIAAYGQTDQTTLSKSTMYAIVNGGQSHETALSKATMYALVREFEDQQRKGGITYIRINDMIKEPNAYNIYIYADRTFEVGEVIWKNIIPENMVLLAASDRSTAELDTAPAEAMVIDIKLDGLDFGTITFEAGSVNGVFFIPEDRTMLKDTVIEFVMRTDGGNAVGLAVNLVSLYK